MIAFNNTVFNLSSDGRRKLSATFRLERGDFAVLLGLNGAGKTTLLDAMAGIRHAAEGKVEVAPANSPIAYAVQDSASGLFPWKSVLSNILFPAAMTKKDDLERGLASTEEPPGLPGVPPLADGLGCCVDILPFSNRKPRSPSE